MPATADNTRLASAPFGNPDSVGTSPIQNVDQNAASLERLDGVRILVNGWRVRERLQPKINRRYF